MVEFWGLLAPYVGTIRSNQTTEEEKQIALVACYSLLHSRPPEEQVEFWLVLETLFTATGNHNDDSPRTS